MNENSVESASPGIPPGEKACAYRILRYTPNLVRDEWVNIGVLLFDPGTGERRLRLIEEQDEYNRVRRLHPQADEALLRALRDDLEDRFRSVSIDGSNGGTANWQRLLGKWDDTLSNALQLAPQKGVLAADLDAELEDLYADHVALQRTPSRAGAPGSRAQCACTARRLSGKPGFGTVSRSLFGSQSRACRKTCEQYKRIGRGFPAPPRGWACAAKRRGRRRGPPVRRRGLPRGRPFAGQAAAHWTGCRPTCQGAAASWRFRHSNRQWTPTESGLRDHRGARATEPRQLADGAAGRGCTRPVLRSVASGARRCRDRRAARRCSPIRREQDLACSEGCGKRRLFPRAVFRGSPIQQSFHS